MSVTAEHWDDPTLEPYKFRHELLLDAGDGAVVVIHVWNNPERVPLADWFHENLQFMADDLGTAVWEEEFTRARVGGLMVQTPRSDQAPSIAAAVFAHGTRVFRVTCIGYDGDAGPEPRALFFEVLDGLELGVAP